MLVCWLVPLKLFGKEIVEFSHTVMSCGLAAVSQIFADGEVGLIGIDIDGVTVEVAISKEDYLSAYLNLPALKF